MVPSWLLVSSGLKVTEMAKQPFQCLYSYISEHVFSCDNISFTGRHKYLQKRLFHHMLFPHTLLLLLLFVFFHSNYRWIPVIQPITAQRHLYTWWSPFREKVLYKNKNELGLQLLSLSFSCGSLWVFVGLCVYLHILWWRDLSSFTQAI